ncbi:hypothetical protein EV424DRAFT_53491 [Suillus variegatus]|nr:hypothetical protein EV424DRAFT_53491 [Suillus variegatus]
MGCTACDDCYIIELELFNPHSISTTSTLCVLTIRNNVTPALRQKLTFHNNLGKGVTIMLAWSPNLDGLYEDFFSIVWKISKFGKLGPYWATETYTAQLAACLLQSPGREWEGHQCCDLHQYQCEQLSSTLKLLAPVQAIMQNSEKTTLTEANDVYHFSVSLAFVDFFLDHKSIPHVAPPSPVRACIHLVYS